MRADAPAGRLYGVGGGILRDVWPDPDPMRLVLFLVLLAAAPAQAQMLASGTWAGTLGDGRAARPATAAIERCATGFKIDLVSAGHSGHTETATYSRGRLAFELARFRLPGARGARPLACTLQMNAMGDFVGACTSGRTRVPLRLSPPADGSLSCG